MLIEEAHHLSVGQKGIERILQRAVQLEKADPNGEARSQGGIDLQTIQKYINYWFSYCLDLFGSEISNNASDFFASGLKGRWKEAKDYTDHSALGQTKNITVVENGRLTERDVSLRSAMNEVLRESYREDCERVLRSWNRALEKEGTDFRVTLPSPRFHRRQGIYADNFFNIEGDIITEDEFKRNEATWLPTDEDRKYVISLMKPVHDKGQCANWIAAPRRGINGQPFEYEYVRL